jgi:hypothetical protein
VPYVELRVGRSWMYEQARKIQAPGSGAVVDEKVPDGTHAQPLLTLQMRAERANNPLFYDSSQQAAVVLSTRCVCLRAELGEASRETAA